MTGKSLLTSFIHYCSSEIKSKTKHLAQDLSAIPQVCSECPYGRSNPCKEARRAQCIYASGAYGASAASGRLTNN